MYNIPRSPTRNEHNLQRTKRVSNNGEISSPNGSEGTGSKTKEEVQNDEKCGMNEQIVTSIDD